MFSCPTGHKTYPKHTCPKRNAPRPSPMDPSKGTGERKQEAQKSLFLGKAKVRSQVRPTETALRLKEDLKQIARNQKRRDPSRISVPPCKRSNPGYVRTYQCRRLRSCTRAKGRRSLREKKCREECKGGCALPCGPRTTRSLRTLRQNCNQN